MMKILYSVLSPFEDKSIPAMGFNYITPIALMIIRRTGRDRNMAL